MFIFSYSKPYLFYDFLGRFGTDYQFNYVEFKIGDYQTYTTLSTIQTAVVGLETEYQAMSIVRGKLKCIENSTIDTCK